MSQNFTPNFFAIIEQFLRWFFCVILFDWKMNIHETTVSQSFKFSNKIEKVSGNEFQKIVFNRKLNKFCSLWYQALDAQIFLMFQPTFKYKKLIFL